MTDIKDIAVIKTADGVVGFKSLLIQNDQLADYGYIF
jgi:hypothetical protein